MYIGCAFLFEKYSKLIRQTIGLLKQCEYDIKIIITIINNNNRSYKKKLIPYFSILYMLAICD